MLLASGGCRRASIDEADGAAARVGEADSRAAGIEPSGSHPDAPEAAGAGATEASAGGLAEQIRTLTGGRTRLVWVQDVGEGTDTFAQGLSLRLMGLDTDDGRGERAIADERGNYAKPLLTPAGDRIVYSDRSDGRIYVVDWDGGNKRPVTRGFALAVWLDPRDRRVWVYFGRDRVDETSYRTVWRHPLDQSAAPEPVWAPGPVTEDSFQLSRDGLWAAGTFPWPTVGVVRVAAEQWQRLGHGCWTAMAPDNSYTAWYFDGAHRNLTMVNTRTERSWRVNISGAPGVKGSEVYHPRWGNHPRIIAVTGPYLVGGGDNRIRGGGKAVEIHLGRFSADYIRIERWQRATRNERADFLPDVWVAPEAWRGAPPVAAPAEAAAREAVRAAPPRLRVEARLLEATRIPTPRAIEPYRHALVVHQYRVEPVSEGEAPEEILVAHWAIRDGRVLDEAARQRGEVYGLTLERYDDHPELEGERLVTDINRADLRLFYDVAGRH